MIIIEQLIKETRQKDKEFISIHCPTKSIFLQVLDVINKNNKIENNITPSQWGRYKTNTRVVLVFAHTGRPNPTISTVLDLGIIDGDYVVSYKRVVVPSYIGGRLET